MKNIIYSLKKTYKQKNNNMPAQVVSTIGVLYSFITTDLAWLYLLIGIFMVVIAFIMLTTKYGDIKLGGKNAQPHYKTFTWISMMLCSALAAGILIFGMCEWMYYINTTPFGIEPGSIESYEYASAYGMFHWGISAWAFYLMPGIAIGYLYWNKEIGSVRVSLLVGNILKDEKTSHKIMKWIIDILLVLCYFIAIMTTVGIGTPVIGELVSSLIGIENSFGLKISVIIVFCIFFTLSTSGSIAKGMGRISDFNVWLSIGFFIFVLIVGDTTFILNNIVMAIGTNIREFVRMSFNTDAVAQTGFIQGWTIFYWAWYVALAVLCGTWIARTSYGRTFKEITIANCIWAPLACWITFGILGNYGMAKELFEGYNFSGVINELGNNGVTLQVLQTMPFSKICITIFAILIFFNLATSATANGTSLSMYTSSGLKADEEPNPWYKTFWCMMFLILPVGVLFLENSIEGLNVLSTIQSMTTVSSLPVLIALYYLFVAFIKALKTDVEDGTILNYIEENKAYKWKN
ncbi:BCCT transporter [Candidatus Epulonipiscium fishelsonii]|nr:BCCT transporter [Epulopiscium sp. SCG-C06WGA-EpuloA1]